MPCPRCQTPNPPSARFCGECGAPLEGLCPACRSENPPGNKFCHGCGRPLGGETTGFPSRSSLDEERKQVTIVFADLKASMEMLAHRDPEDARRLLDPVLVRMAEAVRYYGGTVNQVMGDGIMALFGAPRAQEDHAVRACYAALRMQQSLRRYAAEVQATEGVPIRARIGLNSGDVVVRSIGSDVQLDYTAVGEATHLAARMEQNAPPGSILITEAVRRLAEHAIEVKPLAPLQVAGLERPVAVYELLGTAARRRVGRPAGRFVGRVEALERLARALGRARRGQGQVVAVSGDAGVGKTRFCQEFIGAHVPDGWRVVRGSGVSYGHQAAYLPIVELLREYFGIEADHTADQVREIIGARIAGLPSVPEAIVPPLFALLEVLPEHDPFRSLDPRLRRSRTMEALEHLLLGASGVQPVLVLIENLHWVDTESRAFLERLIEGLPRARLLLLLTYRSEYRHPWTDKADYTELRMEPFSPQEAGELLRSLIGDDPGLEPLRALLIQRSGGNPLFLQDSVRMLLEANALTAEGGVFRLRTPLEEIRMPATVRAVLATRVDQLAPHEKAVLQTAAVIGKDVPLVLLQAAASLSEDVLRDSLRQLVSAGFLTEVGLLPESEYTFTHSLLQEVTYEGLLRSRRRAQHARIVEFLEKLYPDRIAAHVERLAFHASRGEVWAKAVAYHRQAGVKAAERSANREAVEHLSEALRALGHRGESRESIAAGIDLRLDLRAPLLQLGRLDEALAVSEEAEKLAQRLGDERILARVYTYLINYHYMEGEPAQALAYGERCLATGQQTGDVALAALARQYVGQSLSARGDYQRALAVLESNVERLETARGTELDGSMAVSYVVTCGWLAFTLAELGEFDRAETYLDKARQVADASGRPYAQVIARSWTGFAHLQRGRLDGAVLPLELSLEACREKSLEVWHPIPLALLGLVLVRIGRVSEGLPLLEGAVTRSEELGIKAYLARWTVHLGEGLLAAGRPDDALAVAERALDMAARHQEAGQRGWASWLLGEIAARREPPRAEEAIGHYQAAVGLARDLGMRPLLAWSHRGLARLYGRLGDRAQAEEQLGLASALAQRMGLHFPGDETKGRAGDTACLFIVARGHAELQTLLARRFAGAKDVSIIVDQRRGERRQRRRPADPDLRRGPRRHGSELAPLDAWGLAILHQPLGRPELAGSGARVWRLGALP
jgi:class 3 adenylate cyclase/tetratricopeptide (TPR) repeat protein